MPYALKNAAAVVVSWSTVAEPEQIVLDLRDKKVKELLQADKPTHTIKLWADVYEVKPHLVYSIKSKPHQKDAEIDFRPGLHYLKKQG